jgi:hypothetical protein
MNEDAWIQELKVGDVVFFSQEYGAAPVRSKVLRLTNTMVAIHWGEGPNGEVFEKKFNRTTGKSVGDDCWHSQYLIKDSPQERERVAIEQLKRTAIKLRNGLGVPSDRPRLEAFIAALTPLMEKEAGK